MHQILSTTQSCVLVTLMNVSLTHTLHTCTYNHWHLTYQMPSTTQSCGLVTLMNVSLTHTHTHYTHAHTQTHTHYHWHLTYRMPSTTQSCGLVTLTKVARAADWGNMQRCRGCWGSTWLDGSNSPGINATSMLPCKQWTMLWVYRHTSWICMSGKLYGTQKYPIMCKYNIHIKRTMY